MLWPVRFQLWGAAGSSAPPRAPHPCWGPAASVSLPHMDSNSQGVWGDGRAQCPVPQAWFLMSFISFFFFKYLK